MRMKLSEVMSGKWMRMCTCWIPQNCYDSVILTADVNIKYVVLHIIVGV